MNKQELIERYLKMVKLKDIIKRINELEHSAKQYWIDEILKELGSDYGRLKYRSGYEQGKLEGMVEREKVIVPQCVAEWIERAKQEKRNLRNALNNGGEKMRLWFLDQENYNLFARAWLDGYEVEEEKRYRVRLKGLDKDLEYLNFKHGHVWVFSDNIENEEYRTAHTHKELEEAGFGWVFDCPGIEVEEVEV